MNAEDLSFHDLVKKKLASLLNEEDQSEDIARIAREFYGVDLYKAEEEDSSSEEGSSSEEEEPQSYVEKTRHLPLYQIRDRPGQPFTNLICNGCLKQAELYSDFKHCSRCKATKYCSRECQMRDWTGKASGITASRCHKDMCPELAQAREEFQNNQDCGEGLRTTLFRSWAAEHHPLEGSFFDSEFRERLGIYGQEEVGFWAQPQTLGAPYMANGKDITGFQNGAMLLQPEFPSLKEGWKILKTTEYPPAEPPTNPLPPQGIRNWREYLAWRNLEATSIAPLLLSYVLTVYQMLHHELGFCAQETSKNKSTLRVYLVGVESELNFIPIFAELAFLMPGIDLNLIMISPAAKQICLESKKYPNSILQGKRGRSSKRDQGNLEHTVLDIPSPEGGRLRVGLCSQVEYLHEIARVPFSLPLPHAVIGLNAGLGSYGTWARSILGLLDVNIPFCFSDQAKLQLHFVEKVWLPQLCRQWNDPRITAKEVLDFMTIKLNPFHGIVNRDVAAILVPNINNGYLLTWKKTK